MDLPSVFLRYRDGLGTALHESVGSDDSLLYRMVRYHIGWCDEAGHPANAAEGKYLRPTLCLLSCEAAGSDWRDALPGAVGLELTHAFSLVHDDIQDGDRERRHRPTVWSLWGVGQAINAGDALAVMANLAALRVARDRAADTSAILSRASLAMLEGQCMDLASEGRLDFTEKDYLEVIKRKTGALISASMEMGAYLGSGRPDLAAEFGRAGLDVGLAFQIQDDVLGIWGVSEHTGKPVGSDLRRRKRTLPVVLGLLAPMASDRAVLEDLCGEGPVDDERVAAAIRTLDALRVRDRCRELADSYCDAALARLRRLPIDEWALSQFEGLLAFLKARDR